MNICNECGNDYELHSTDGARCPKNQGNLIDGKLEFFATHFDDGLSEVERLTIQRDQARKMAIEKQFKIIQLDERIAQDELAFGFMREANTLLTADVKRLTAELEQCKHAPDDEGEDVDMCRCGHHGHEHKTTQFMTMGCFHQNKSNVYCGCLEFRKAAK